MGPDHRLPACLSPWIARGRDGHAFEMKLVRLMSFFEFLGCGVAIVGDVFIV